MQLPILNPSLAVSAIFLVSAGGDPQRTILSLAGHPGLARFVLSILDFVLASRGQPPPGGGPAVIAEPPGEPTRQRLVAGQVLFATRRPDGGLDLRLNPEFDLNLGVHARRADACAVSERLPLLDDPALSRWLLTHAQGAAEPAAPVNVEPALVAPLRRLGVLVDAAPAPRAWFPDPKATADPGEALAVAARVFPPEPSRAIPSAVRARLGRHTPALPPEVPLAWFEDAGTGLVYPMLHAPGAASGTGAGARRDSWARQREEARRALRERRHATLRGIVPAPQREQLRAYVRQLVARGYFPALGDGQVELRAALHNEPTVAALHEGLAGIVNSICPEEVQASYCYLSCYEEGAVLARHRDRQQCAYNLSLVLDMQDLHGDPRPWPIHLEVDGKAEAVELDVGDGLCYSGTDIWHWRDALPRGQRAIVCFYHFVRRDYTGSLD